MRKQLRKTGMRVVLYFIFTTVVAVSMGILVTMIIQPGNFMDISMMNSASQADIPQVADAAGNSRGRNSYSGYSIK